jgi:glycosyltransferase involved in cell wall biosynthesis
MARPSLLFIAPIVPAPTGNGLAMRAGAFLDAFCRDYTVTLVVIPVAGQAPVSDTVFVEVRTQRATVISLDGKLDPLWLLISSLIDEEARTEALSTYPRPALCRYATSPCIQAIADTVRGQQFDVMHVMRLYLAPYLGPLLEKKGDLFRLASLDLDDDEPATHLRLAEMYRDSGRRSDERIEVAEADKYEGLEQAWLKSFQRISSSMKHSRMATHVVPNTVALPAPRDPPKNAANRMLFVGNLSYQPNIEGLQWFIRNVIPLIGRLSGSPPVLRLIGGSPGAEVLALNGIEGVEVVANPLELASHYRWADLIVIPIFAGGGTRIKLLEAFAYQVPVVSTSLGAEGIAADNCRHLLLADTAQAFAFACTELLTNQEHSSALTRRARRLVETRYSHAAGHAAIRSFLQGHRD